MVVEDAPAHSRKSRYKQDFDELEKIGEGGQGCVYRAIHKVGQQIKAIKKIKLSWKNVEENDRIRREVSVLSCMHSLHIVRYFHAWIEVIEDPEEIKQLNFSSDSESEEEESKGDIKEDSDSVDQPAPFLRKKPS